jgi:hypothetical protein
MRESLEGERTEVDVRMPPADPEDFEDDELAGATHLWGGERSVPPPIVPMETLGPRLGAHKLRAIRDTLEKGPKLADLTRRQLVLAAVGAGGLAFAAALLLRLLLG